MKIKNGFTFKDGNVILRKEVFYITSILAVEKSTGSVAKLSHWHFAINVVREKDRFQIAMRYKRKKDALEDFENFKAWVDWVLTENVRIDEEAAHQIKVINMNLEDIKQTILDDLASPGGDDFAMDNIRAWQERQNQIRNNATGSEL